MRFQFAVADNFQIIFKDIIGSKVLINNQGTCILTKCYNQDVDYASIIQDLVSIIKGYQE